MKISIITVCYNSEKTIEKTFESVKKVKEHSNDVEYIVVDGNSTDKTKLIIDNYKNIIDVFISENDDGMYDALNKGIRASKSEWIMLLAADDQIIEKGIHLFLNSVKIDTQIWCGSIVCFDGKGYYIENSDNRLELLKDSCVLRNPASVFRRDIFEKYGYYDKTFKCNGDGELFYRMYVNNVKFQIEEIPLVIFNYGGMSTVNPAIYAIPERSKIYRKYNLYDEKTIAKKEKIAIFKIRLKTIVKNVLIFRWVKNKKYMGYDILKEIGLGDEYIRRVEKE